MISDDCEHRIEVNNLKHGEIVQHTLLLIKGHIRQLRPLKKCVEQQIHLHVKYNSSLESTPWELEQQSQISRNGQFKLLCDLGQHVPVTGNYRKLPLQLHFCYCNSVLHIEILYECPTNNYLLQALYIKCSNQHTKDEEVRACFDKINLNLRLVQSVYADQLRAAAYGRSTFTLNGDCKVFETQLTCEEVWQLNEESLWQNFAEEILNSSAWGGEDKLKFVAFIGCTKYDAAAIAASGDFSYANIRRNLKGHAALGGGGLALFGAAYLYAWPRYCKDINAYFGSTEKVDPTQLPDDSNYRCTYGGVYATTLGAVVHEIGHTFDLGHTIDGVMGNGFDYINRVFTIDNLTEHLPDRVIERTAHALNVQVAERPRFTQLKRSTNKFLEKYHEQKTSDPFYFTRNCAIILAHNKWFKNCRTNGDVFDLATVETLLKYDPADKCVISGESKHALCLIEVRTVDKSLVKYWYEPSKSDSLIYKFHLPQEAIEALEKDHYLFVLTRSGVAKRLCEPRNC
uniref:Putative zinc metalloproteinase YIL108W n=1 Tax=Ceratitis capitata TaxID=7213 RepID=W8AN20_CERCA